MATNMAIWEKAGMKRVYVNGIGAYGEKVWFEADATDGTCVFRFKGICNPSYLVATYLRNNGESLLVDLGIDKYDARVLKFDALCELVSKGGTR